MAAALSEDMEEQEGTLTHHPSKTLREELPNPFAAIRAKVSGAVADQAGIATGAALEEMKERYPILDAILAGRTVKIELRAEIVE